VAQAGEEGDEGGFPGAGEPDDGYEFVLSDGEIHVLEDIHTFAFGAETYGDVVEFQEGCFLIGGEV